jgi:hypothetical protein
MTKLSFKPEPENVSKDTPTAELSISSEDFALNFFKDFLINGNWTYQSMSGTLTLTMEGLALTRIQRKLLAELVRPERLHEILTRESEKRLCKLYQE